MSEDESPISSPVTPPVRRRRGRSALEWVAVVAIAVVASLLFRAYVVQTFFIPSGSMEPTLHVGDRILVSKLSVEWGHINRGDILVFKAPAAAKADCSDPVTDFVKRVVGLPGETIWSHGNTIYVQTGHGAPHALTQNWPHVEPLKYPIKKQTIPANHYFMMGDNQPSSCDSRFWGTLPRSSIIGKAFLRVWPLSRFAFL